MDASYQLLLTAPKGASVRDITQLAASVAWGGDIRQIARELTVRLAVPRDGSVEPPDVAEGSWLTLTVKGETQFTGPVVQCTTSSLSFTADVSALDEGRFLAGNKGWYQFVNVPPEEAAAAVCRDAGISAASLARTGLKISRKFPGVALDRILATLYTLAGEQNGKRYLVRMTGPGELEILEKPQNPSLEIVRTAGVTNTWDLTRLCNRVAIYSVSGQRIGQTGDAASQALHGRLEHVLVQGKDRDAMAQAKAWLEDNGRRQTLRVEVLDPPLELRTGAAVRLRDTGSGVSGLFWVDSDRHTWKDGVHKGTFALNFRNLMDESSAGSEN